MIILTCDFEYYIQEYLNENFSNVLFFSNQRIITTKFSIYYCLNPDETNNDNTNNRGQIIQLINLILQYQAKPLISLYSLLVILTHQNSINIISKYI